MPVWLSEYFEKSNYFLPHGHCYFWMPSILWLHVVSDALIGIAYLGISLILYLLVRKIRLPFSPVFIAFGLFIGLCGLTHFMKIWTIWNPDYLLDGLVKAATAAASFATAIGLFFIRPQVEEVVHTARLSEERRIRLESTHAELEALYKKVKELDELKTQFFANVSHELRTPLALILGPAERMLDDRNLTSEQKRQLQIISHNGKSLLKQVNDLLDVAKLEAGKMQIHYVRLDLASWFRRTASQFEIAAEQRRIKYRISAPKTLIAEVDPDMLERVFINLLSNAFKFTPLDGEIHAEIKGGENEFRFSVADTGPGIGTDQQQSIFERFRQADGGATRRHGGTGLGLAIVKDFVDLHGGRIDVISALGAGARFVVHFPLFAPASAEVKAAPPALAPMTEVALEAALHELANEPLNAAEHSQLRHAPHRPRVLVVEDNAEMSRFIAGTLSSEFNVYEACDGREGLERALAIQPDLIITDLMMPRMSGDQLVSELRNRRDFDAIPILLLTAKADDELRVKLLQNGAQDYLTKPFLPRELLARAGNLIAIKRTGDTLRKELASASSNIEGLAKELSIKHRQLQTALDAAEVAREQAEKASQVKSHFLALMSHELRTPLSTLLLNTQLLSQAKERHLPSSFKSPLERMTRAAQQMSTLIEGLLEYTRIESGRVTVHLENIDAAKLAQEVIEAQAESAPPGVQISLEPASVAGTQGLGTILTDSRLLSVILSNLISNALKYTHQGKVAVRIYDAAGCHVFEVQDTGIGIPEADLHRIFQPFEQLEPIHRKSIPGIGMGLALVKHIIDALKGKVEVESMPGKGSVFRVSLPSNGY